MFKSSYDIAVTLRVLFEDHGIPFEHMVVGGGGALVAMGLREHTQDINLWVNEESFHKLAVHQKVICHPMTDVAFQYESGHGKEWDEEHPIWIRKRNTYFPICNEEGIQIFDVLTLMIQKRGGYAQPERSKAKRDQDLVDIRLLNDLMAEKNKVRESA
jgi:hypothetical protein